MNNQTLNEINKRDLDKCYFSLSFSYSTIYFNDGNDYIYQRKVYTLIGCNIFGVRILLLFSKMILKKLLTGIISFKLLSLVV